MNIIAIIPARMGSSRFPGKPLKNIKDIPMIGHVFLRTSMAKTLDGCYVATCDQEIKEYIETIGGKAIMTSDKHERCSDRCAEAMLKIEEETGQKIDYVVMVQGDEPLVTPEMVDASVQALKQGEQEDAGVSCLMGAIETKENFEDPNEIKVVVDLKGNALYMSREPIPTMKRDKPEGPWLKQICVITFTRKYLLEFNAMEPTPLEIAESVDLNRCLEHGHKVKMAFSPDKSVSVDTPEDLAVAETEMQNDALIAKYINNAKQKVA